ncbi:MAG TPA: serine endoprotease DegP [Franconibacter helveticus]|nr:serine endoprotease DegP [Franconibacter helveticus]
MKKTTLAMSALALSLGLALGPVSAFAAETASSSATSQQMPSLAPMLEKVMPSVVSINVEGSTTVNTPRLPRNFQQFFGDNSPFCQEGSPFQSSPFCQGGVEDGDGGQQQKFMALGSGVIIDAAKGYVVTNNHVVDNATSIKVQLSDGRKLDAKMVGKDPRSDIALIQIQDPKNLTAIKIADSDQLRVGDYTVAIGNPFGLGETVTSGIVSALGRSGLNAENYENFIQTDAAINRGNSGGALVNLNGELIGINTAILAPDGGNIGSGFAIPINLAETRANQLIQFGEIRRGLLGIKGTEMSADIAKAFNLNVQRGAFVSEVLPGSGSAKAGIKSGDVIISLNGKPLSSFAELRSRIATTEPGTKVKLGLLRDGKPQEVEVTLDKSTTSSASAEMIAPALQGATLSDGQLKDGTKGVAIDEVEKGSAAAQIGLHKDDVIIGVNRDHVQSIAEMRKVLESKPAVIALHIVRGSESIYLLLR